MRLRSNPVITAIRRRWNGLSLAIQYWTAGSAVLLTGMILIGFWVTKQIEAGVLRNTAATTALFVDSVIAPLLPNLRETGSLSEGQMRALDETLSQGTLGERLASFKIWHPNGEIFYATEPSLIGQKFEPGENLIKALGGSVAAEFDELSDDENALERKTGASLMEIYSPIREPWSGEVLAVAEFYETAEDLQENLRSAALGSWLVVGAVTAAMMGLLSGIVFRGSRVIETQRLALEERVAELSDLLAQNRSLHQRVEGAARRASAVNESYLRRISADLHDGPAQLVAFAALRLDSANVKNPGNVSPRRMEELANIKSCLDEAMLEIRSICSGLRLPQIESARLSEILRLAAVAHEQKTGSRVTQIIIKTDPDLAPSEKICIFRFVQETLNNAFRHAGGAGQRIAATCPDGMLTVEVSDDGTGFDRAEVQADSLGLAGLRDRVESIGGQFRVETSPAGTRVSMELDLKDKKSWPA